MITKSDFVTTKKTMCSNVSDVLTFLTMCAWDYERIILEHQGISQQRVKNDSTKWQLQWRKMTKVLTQRSHATVEICGFPCVSSIPVFTHFLAFPFPTPLIRTGKMQ